MNKNAGMKMKLAHINAKDRELLVGWLDKEHIYRWFGDSEYWLEEFRFEPTSSFLLFLQSVPVGFCRYTQEIPEGFLISAKNILNDYNGLLHKTDRPDNNIMFAKYLQSRAENLFFIDYAIGEEACLGKGIGKKLLQLLITEIRKKVEQSKVSIAAGEKINTEWALFASSSLKNRASCRMLEAQGFEYLEKLGLFAYILRV